jgi:hypothetical protein
VGFESGQVYSVKLLQNMVSNRTPYLPPIHTVYVNRKYSTLFHTGKGGGRVEPERRGGARGEYRSQSWVEITS